MVSHLRETMFSYNSILDDGLGRLRSHRQPHTKTSTDHTGHKNQIGVERALPLLLSYHRISLLKFLIHGTKDHNHNGHDNEQTSPLTRRGEEMPNNIFHLPFSCQVRGLCSTKAWGVLYQRMVQTQFGLLIQMLV